MDHSRTFGPDLHQHQRNVQPFTQNCLTVHANGHPRPPHAKEFSLPGKVNRVIWDLDAESELLWDHFGTLVPFGTKSQIRDLTAAPAWKRRKELHVEISPDSWDQ